MTMGQIIASARRAQGLTQEALAQMLGVSNQAVSKWESDQCCPDITLLPKLADTLGLSLNELFGIAPREPEAADTSEAPQEAEELQEAVEPEDPEEPEEPEEPVEPDELTPVSGGEKLRAALLSVAESFTGKGKEKTRVEGLPWKDDNTMRVVVFIGHRLITHMNAAPKIEFTYNGPALDVNSELNLTCGDVQGAAAAGANITCGDVGGDVDGDVSAISVMRRKD